MRHKNIIFTTWKMDKTYMYLQASRSVFFFFVFWLVREVGDVRCIPLPRFWKIYPKIWGQKKKGLLKSSPPPPPPNRLFQAWRGIMACMQCSYPPLEKNPAYARAYLHVLWLLSNDIMLVKSNILHVCGT